MKFVHSTALFASLMLCAACGNNENTPDFPKENLDGKQYITLRVSESRSRAGRELLSSELTQSIENVKVIVTCNDTVVWTRLLDKWNSDDETIELESTENDGYRETVIEIPKDEYRLLEDQEYNVYAFGYTNDSDYDLTAIINAEPTEDKKHPNLFFENTPITLRNGIGEEIFAGAAKTMGNYDGVDINVVLYRQVAGTFGYFTCIPYVKVFGHLGRYLKLVASNPQNTFVAGMFDNSSLSEDKSQYFIVNDGSPLEQNVIYTIDLLDWFKTITLGINPDGVPNQLIATGDNWIGDPKRYAPGSVFGSSFILPFAKNGETTFTLLLCSEDDTVVRTWNVTMPADSKQLDEFELWSYQPDGWMSAAVTDDILCYNVLRNHLYGIGTKAFDILPDDYDPEIGDPEIEEPTPINNKQELIIQVNHNWDAIYNMGIE